ncbi:MAG: hypothetical protein AAGH74_10040 [Pseudomonadota bacterium]
MRVIIMLIIMVFFFFTAIVMVGATAPDSGETLGDLMIKGLRMLLTSLSGTEG